MVSEQLAQSLAIASMGELAKLSLRLELRRIRQIAGRWRLGWPIG